MVIMKNIVALVVAPILITSFLVVKSYLEQKQLENNSNITQVALQSQYLSDVSDADRDLGKALFFTHDNTDTKSVTDLIKALSEIPVNLDKANEKLNQEK